MAALACALCALILLAGVAAIATAQDGEPAASPRGDGQTIYKRKGSGGRVLFTNAEEAVPVEERARSRVDLAKTSLNPELGNAIEQQVHADHAALARARGVDAMDCSALESLASRDTFTRIWEDDPLVLVGAGLALLLAVFSPFLLGKLGVPSFFRMFAPFVVIGAAVAFGMQRSDRSLAELKAKLAPCLAPKLEGLAGVPSLTGTPVAPEEQQAPPRPVPRSGAIQNVRSDLQAIEGMQEDRTDRAMKPAIE
jgi:hypothetical protein